ncbi:MAG: alpha/beta hydrolase-fold protein [Acidobacteriota bacterium]
MRVALPLLHRTSSNLNKLVRVTLLTVFLAVCSGSGVAQPAPQAPQGPSFATFTIKSAVLGEDRPILVRTPVGYEASKVGYPVLYMTDGNAHMTHTAGSVEFLARNGRMSEAIVVGIPNTDRMRDLSPTRPKTAGATGAPDFPTAGGADNFLKFIETELIPEIGKRYRVTPYRILAGHSLGGLFAVHAMLTKPDLFQAYIAASPALGWDNQFAIKRAEDFFKNRKEFNATFFMTIANEPGELEDAFHQMKQILTRNQAAGFEWEATEMPDEDHGTVVLRTHYFALRKIFNGWQIPRDPTSGAFAGGLKEADEHYAKLSKKFHYTLTVPEQVVNQIGYQHLFAEQIDQAIAVLKTQVERYPESANPYDSLGEAYERAGKLDLAVPMYEKAAAIGKQNNLPNAALFQTNYERAAAKLKAQKEGAVPAKATP